MKKMLILLSICTCVFACSKDDNEIPSGNGSYQAGDVVTVDAPVMYSIDHRWPILPSLYSGDCYLNYLDTDPIWRTNGMDRDQP